MLDIVVVAAIDVVNDCIMAVRNDSGGLGLPFVTDVNMEDAVSKFEQLYEVKVDSILRSVEPRDNAAAARLAYKSGMTIVSVKREGSENNPSIVWVDRNYWVNNNSELSAELAGFCRIFFVLIQPRANRQSGHVKPMSLS